MQFDRLMTVVDNGIYETLDALLDQPFALCSIVTDSEGQAVDYRFLRLSPGFQDATGLAGAEGRSALELVPDLDRKWLDLYGRVALDRAPLRFREASSVMGREVDVSAAPLDPPGCFVIAFRERTALPAEGEHTVAASQAEHLLKELGHRVMNSFASISAILAMETRAAPPDARDALRRVQGRVQALAALYRRLDGASEMDQMEVAGYLAGNLQSFRDALAAPAGLTVECDLQPLTLSTRAVIPLALVVNEILTDAVVQAREGGRTGPLRVTLRREGETGCLVIAHRGAPLPDGISRALVTAFVAELGGEMAFEEQPDGTSATVSFPV
jgi:two-component sensor histidine kinase